MLTGLHMSVKSERTLRNATTERQKVWLLRKMIFKIITGTSAAITNTLAPTSLRLLRLNKQNFPKM